jgi:hypothetical protein
VGDRTSCVHGGLWKKVPHYYCIHVFRVLSVRPEANVLNQPSYFHPIGSTSTIHCQHSSTYVTSVARDTEYSSTQPVRISAFTV